ncbi:DNA polymerase zeta [Coemansia pectinata]|uniref:DNA polymerase zeta catalytic subunit n=1 Tax=Coemansia pectinata TaxID=1052879 RepID=A0A9W8LC10_9FUNG|nr:DNA polymerase zeta [Coemansia pectinata]
MTELGESEEEAALEVQIGNIDYYMAPPTPADCALRTPYNIFDEPLKQVPVIRIFGITRSEQRICLHVHQVWPYLYVAYDGTRSIEAVRTFGYQLGLSLNHALNVSLKNSSGSLFVAAVVPVKGVPFYGFCAGYRPFLKVFLANPDILVRASNLLASGAVMGRRHKIFESHLSYIMQFLVDYNLYGVDWARLDRVLYRSPLPEHTVNTGHPLFISDDTVSTQYRWVPQGMPSYLVSPAPPDRACRCELEADAVAADVANRRQVRERQIHHVFQEGMLDANFGKLIHSLDSIWIDENRRRAQLGLDPLQPKNSQVLPDTSQLPDCEPATQARAGGLQWSNHWRLHSLLQSALAGDRRKYQQQLDNNQNDMMTDMLDQYSSLASNDDATGELDTDTFGVDAAWLSAWPTCREVDVGDIHLIPGDDPGNRWFYTQLASSSLPAQHADQDADSGKHLEVTPPKSTLEVHQGTPLAPAIWPVIVDVELINSIEAGTHVVGTHTGDTGNESTNSSEPLRVCCNPPVSSASETDDLEDFDDSWLEGELPCIEEEYEVSSHAPISRVLYNSRPPRKSLSIPQLDGAADNDERYITASNRHSKRSANSRCETIKHSEPYRKGGRVVAPLCLAYSASSIEDRPDIDKKHRRHRVGSALVLRRAYDFPAKGVSGRGTRSATRIPEGRIAASCHSTTRIEHAQPESCFTRRQSDVYVDIPHVEGQFLANFVKSRRSGEPSITTSVASSTDWGCEGDIPDVDCSSLGTDLGCSSLLRDDCSIAYVYKLVPPSIDRLVSTLSAYNLAEAVTPVPAFSDDQDMPKQTKVYSGHRIRLSSRSAHSLPMFNPTYEYSKSCSSLGDEYSRSVHNDRRQDMWGKEAIACLNSSVAMTTGTYQQWHEDWWRYSQPPPKVRSSNIGAEAVAATAMQRRQRDQSDLKWSSVLGTLSTYSGVTSQGAAAVVAAAASSLSMTSGTSVLTSKRLLTCRSAKVPMSLMSLEILTCCRETAHADPSLDEILCISASFVRHTSQGHKRHIKYRDIVWTCGLSTESTARMGLSSRVERQHFADELSMILALVDWTHDNDPDIICGYEVQQGSWGYVIERAEVAYDIHLCSKLSRIIKGPPRKHQSQRFGREKDSWGHRKGAAITIVGKSRQSAFRIGQEIADAVTKMNPAPVKLKFEKVYQPCILLTKKRYTGWMYTTAEQREPLLDVKGMELVRRDGCVATQRILEGTLDNLFRTNDLSLVKSFITTEITRLLRGELPLQEYIIAKEVRMGTYSGRTLPAHAKVAADDMQNDPRAEPQHGERVPYVVISSGRNARLIDQVIRPHQLLKRPELRINSQYYVDKQVVPALDRVLSLVGVDVHAWVNDMPRRLRGSVYDAALDAHSDSEGEASHDQASKRAALRTLDHFYNKRDCFLCGHTVSHMPSSSGSARSVDLSTARACDDCRAHKPAMLANVGAIQREAGQALKVVLDQCAACVGGPRADALLAAQACDCLDCPTMFQRSVLSRRYAAWHRASQALEDGSS